MARLVPVGRDRRLLLPINPCEWTAGGDPAHFVAGAEDRVPVFRIYVDARGSGSAQRHSWMMLALLVCRCARGLFSSRRIWRRRARTNRAISSTPTVV